LNEVHVYIIITTLYYLFRNKKIIQCCFNYVFLKCMDFIFEVNGIIGILEMKSSQYGLNILGCTRTTRINTKRVH